MHKRSFFKSWNLGLRYSYFFSNFHLGSAVKKRKFSISFSRSLSFLIASLKAIPSSQFSSLFFSSFTWSSHKLHLHRHDTRIQTENRILYCIQSKHNFFLWKAQFFGYFLYGRLFWILICKFFFCLKRFIGNISQRSAYTNRIVVLKYLRISPIIMGTAYVENLTFWVTSKLSIAFIRPIHPTWKRSSTYSPLLLNLWITLNTSLKFPFINSSLPRYLLYAFFRRALSFVHW